MGSGSFGGVVLLVDAGFVLYCCLVDLLPGGAPGLWCSFVGLLIGFVGSVAIDFDLWLVLICDC